MVKHVQPQLTDLVRLKCSFMKAGLYTKTCRMEDFLRRSSSKEQLNNACPNSGIP